MRNKVEWSDKRWKEFIIEQRKRLWLPDTVEKLAKWLDQKQGMKVADIQKGDAYNLDFEDNSIELAEDILWTLWTMWSLGVCGHWEFVGFESLVDFVDSVHNVYKKNILTLNLC